MFVDRRREKLLQAIVYFCERTKHCHTLKLFKLLNLLDQEHFRQTGRTVTGLKYYAFPQGPVPKTLWKEMSDAPADDLRRALTVITKRDSITNDVSRRDLKPRIKFDSSVLTKRELEIMRRLELLFDTARGEDMSELSHMRGLPWRKVWADGEGNGREIPEELSLKTEALVSEVPTIENDELLYRRELLSEHP